MYWYSRHDSFINEFFCLKKKIKADIVLSPGGAYFIDFFKRLTIKFGELPPAVHFQNQIICMIWRLANPFEKRFDSFIFFGSSCLITLVDYFYRLEFLELPLTGMLIFWRKDVSDFRRCRVLLLLL